MGELAAGHLVWPPFSPGKFWVLSVFLVALTAATLLSHHLLSLPVFCAPCFSALVCTTLLCLSSHCFQFHFYFCSQKLFTKLSSSRLRIKGSASYAWSCSYSFVWPDVPWWHFTYPTRLPKELEGFQNLSVDHCMGFEAHGYLNNKGCDPLELTNPSLVLLLLAYQVGSLPSMTNCWHEPAGRTSWKLNHRVVKLQ